jgi:hypothetical protein
MNLKDIEIGKKVWYAAQNGDGGSRSLTILGEYVRNLLENNNFQYGVKPWLETCFGNEIATNKIERNHRFLEEALELVQSCNCTRDEAHQLVDYVFNRPIGEKEQEVGGVMVTLAALCLANSIDMHKAGDAELTRVWSKIDLIRQKQAAKPSGSPLPGPTLSEEEADKKFKDTLRENRGTLDYNFNLTDHDC